MSAACARCGVRAARREYHLWRPELCGSCVEEVKHPTMRAGVAAAARAAEVGECVACGAEPALGDAWESTLCRGCIAARREAANRMLPGQGDS